MIYTVTLNPSIDYTINIDQVKFSGINHFSHYYFLPGGKGINVSLLLNNLGLDNILWGFVGGFTGDFILKQLHNYKLNTDFIRIKDNNRINIKLESEKETQFNGTGPQIKNIELKKLKDKFSALKLGDLVVLSGSLPNQLSFDFYLELIHIIKLYHADFVIDTTGVSLLKAIKESPLIIKPNIHELSNIFHTNLHDLNEVVAYARKLYDMGARHVIVSMGARGGVLVTRSGTYYAAAPKGKVVSTVGAGDAMLAGFISQIYNQSIVNIVDAFCYSIASGSATAFTNGLANLHQIESLIAKITVQRLN